MNNFNTQRQLAPTVVVVDANGKRGREFKNGWRASIEATNVKSVACHVDGLEDRVVEAIEKYGRGSIVVGCVAWMSNARIIDTIARLCEGVLLLVNNENYSEWGNGRVLELYDTLPRIKTPFNLLFSHLEDSPFARMNVCNYAPCRTIKQAGDALMHSKFLVFFRREMVPGAGAPGRVAARYTPCAAWLGSMNFTAKASRNIESAMCVEDDGIARFLFNDFVTTFIQSETLRADGPDGPASAGGDVNNDRPQAREKPVFAGLKRSRPAPRGAGLARAAAFTRPPLPSLSAARWNPGKKKKW